MADNDSALACENVKSNGHNLSILRFVFGFIFCPFVPLLVFLIFRYFGGFSDSSTGSISNFLLICALVSIPASYVFGIPLFFILRKYRRNNLRDYAVCGGLAAFVCSIPFLPISIVAVPIGVFISILIWVSVWMNMPRKR